MNASLGLERGAYKLTIFVNNLFDQRYAAGMTDSYGQYGVHYVTQVITRDSMRYAGVKLGAKF
jgi:iron complex outermembrane receptor protein